MKPKIIIVDDDRDMLQAITRTLRAQPCDLHPFDDPVVALEFVAANDVAIVISDIDMPQMSGLDLMHRVRTIAPNAVRIIVSGATSIDAAVRAINDGAVQRFIRKPYDPADLRAVVTTVLSDADRRAEPAPEPAPKPAKGWRARIAEACPALLSIARDGEGRYVLDGASLDEAPALGLEHLVRACPG